MADQLRMDAVVNDRATGPLRKIREELAAFRETEGMKSLKENMTVLREQTAEFGKAAAGASGVMGGIGVVSLAASLSIGKVVDVFKELAARSIDMKDLANQTGLTIQQIDQLERVAPKFGIAPEQMAKALGTLGDRMIDFRRQTGQLYVELSHQMPDLTKKLLGENPEQQVQEIFKFLDGLAPQMRHRYAELFLGDGDMAKIVQDGLGALNKAQEDTAKRSGHFTAEFMAQAKAFNDSIIDFADSIDDLTMTAGPALFSDLTTAAEQFTKAFDSIKDVWEWWQQNKYHPIAAMGKATLGAIDRQASENQNQEDRATRAGGRNEGIVFDLPSAVSKTVHGAIDGADALQHATPGDSQAHSRFQDDRRNLNPLFHRSAYMTFDDGGSTGGAGSPAFDTMQKAVRSGVLAGLQDYADLKSAQAKGSGKGGFQNASFETDGDPAGGHQDSGSAASIRYNRQHARGPGGMSGEGGADGRFVSTPAGPAGKYRPTYHLGGADVDERVINTIAGEVSTNDAAGVDAVINNMMNRVGSRGWGASRNLLEVARAPGQYAGYRHASAAEAAFIRSRIAAIASGGVEDNTHGSNAYRAGWYHGPWYQQHAADGVMIGGNRFAYEKGVRNGPFAPYEKSARPNVWEGAKKAGAGSDSQVEVTHKGGAEITIKGLPHGTSTHTKTDGLIDSVRLERASTMPRMTWSS